MPCQAVEGGHTQQAQKGREQPHHHQAVAGACDQGRAQVVIEWLVALGQAYRLDHLDMYNTHNAQYNDRGTGNFNIIGGNSVSDSGGGPARQPVAPDLGAKLKGEQSPRGWGLFLMRNMVDQCSDEVDANGHRVHLRLKLAK